MSTPLIAFEDKKMNPLGMGNMNITNLPGHNEEMINRFLVGKTIRVYWSQAGHQLNADDSWITSMCIIGKLEHKGSWFRVLVNDDTYTYFGLDDILMVAVRSKESKRPHSIALISKDNS